MMRACVVVGARPNFMKAAPIIEALRRRETECLLVHTGQHYDQNLSRVFFEELGLPEPDAYLGVGSGSHARQTAAIMMAFEQTCTDWNPDLVIVVGDVNSTMACALVAAKLGVPVAHVEAGLRSFDRTMPEEINRVVTDHLSDLLFTTEQSGNDNLRVEGIPDEKIHFVGNCMVDTLLRHAGVAVAGEPWKELGLNPEEYAILTLHRPSNVDDPATLDRLVDVLGRLSKHLSIIFPVHPRTRQRFEEGGIEPAEGMLLCEPLPYLTFVGLMARARVVLTDSGGIQEETTVLGVPCLTLRPNTERPVTIAKGTNRLVGTDPKQIEAAFIQAVRGDWPQGSRPPLWDGRAGERIAASLETWYLSRCADVST